MNNAGTGKIQEAEGIEEASAPFPVALDRVNKTGHNHRKNQKCPKLHALSHGTGNDRHGGGHENDLEEEIRHAGVIDLSSAFQHITSRVVCTEEKAETGNHAVRSATVHEVVAYYHVHDTGDRIERHVLGQNLNRVLAANEACFKHCKSCRHPHDQGSGHQEIKGVEGIGQVNDRISNTHFFGDCRQGNSQDGKECCTAPIGSWFHLHVYFHVYSSFVINRLEASLENEW